MEFKNFSSTNEIDYTNNINYINNKLLIGGFYIK